MQRLTRSATIGAVAGLALALGVTGVAKVQVAWADPPGGFEHGHGHDQDDQHGRRGDRDDQGRAERHEHGRHFQDHDRVVVRDYFVGEERGGRCPPGLAKKDNGCLPPGQARQWVVGAPLPAGVVAYPLPSALVVQLTPPPVGYQYVRVASDILMVAAGTGMVAAAIQDLGR